jgi:hypothetical protein
MTVGATALWVVSQFFASRMVEGLPGPSSLIVPSLLAAGIGAAGWSSGLSPWLVAPAGGAAFFTLGLLVDRRLLPAVRTLARAKSDASNVEVAAPAGASR